MKHSVYIEIYIICIINKLLFRFVHTIYVLQKSLNKEDVFLSLNKCYILHCDYLC